MGNKQSSPMGNKQSSLQHSNSPCGSSEARRDRTKIPWDKKSNKWTREHPESLTNNVAYIKQVHHEGQGNALCTGTLLPDGISILTTAHCAVYIGHTGDSKAPQFYLETPQYPGETDNHYRFCSFQIGNREQISVRSRVMLTECSAQESESQLLRI